MKPKSAWQWQEISRNVHAGTLSVKTVKDEGWVLLVSDVHWDNPKCDRKRLKRDFDEAVKRDALIVSNGDFFCAMQGKYDRRSSKKDLRPEHQKNNYLDALVETAADWLEPYKRNLALLGQGNHETAIAKNHETDLLDRLACTMRRRGGITGVIGANRMSSYLTDAHIVHTGHSHDSWQFPIRRLRLTNHNKIQQETQMHIRTGGYKDEYGEGIGGWAIERGMPPKVQGGAWVRIYAEPGDARLYNFEITATR
jgi:hypothetical protein